MAWAGVGVGPDRRDQPDAALSHRRLHSPVRLCLCARGARPGRQPARDRLVGDRQSRGRNGPGVVFSPGLVMDREMFAPQVRALRNRYRCITWDERGHGGTAGDRLAPFSYYDSANDLAALLKHLGVAQAVLAGMSQGGFLSLRCALTHPDVVRALILIDTQAGCEDQERL